jgi:hypothetical protein
MLLSKKHAHQDAKMIAINNDADIEMILPFGNAGSRFSRPKKKILFHVVYRLTSNAKSWPARQDWRRRTMSMSRKASLAEAVNKKINVRHASNETCKSGKGHDEADAAKLTGKLERHVHVMLMNTLTADA